MASLFPEKRTIATAPAPTVEAWGKGEATTEVATDNQKQRLWRQRWAVDITLHQAVAVFGVLPKAQDRRL